MKNFSEYLRFINQQSDGNISLTNQVYLDALINSIPCATLILNDSLQIIHCNHKAIREMTSCKDEFLRQLVSTPSQDYHFNISVEDAHFSCCRKKIGSYCHNKSVGEIIFFDSCETPNAVHDNLRIHKDELAHLSKLAGLGEYLGKFAHEISTPLTTLNISIEELSRLLNLGDIEQARQILNSINSATTQMNRVVGSVKKYARQDIPNKHLDIVPLEDVVNEVLSICSLELSHLNIKIETIFLSDNLIIKCCAGSLSQVLLNLITNARDAVKDLDQPWIRIELGQTTDSIFFRVIDSGHGVLKEHESLIFNPFFTTKPRGEGSGLGLRLVRDLINDHNGKVVYYLRDGNSCFEVNLPNPCLSIAC